MKTIFDHEKLRVYQDAIGFVTWTATVLEAVPRRLAAWDQLDRAAASIPLNIAEGNGKYTHRDRCRFLDIARGSALECAACLDVLMAHRVIDATTATCGKEQLHGIVSMLVGLIKRTSEHRVYDEGEAYEVKGAEDGPPITITSTITSTKGGSMKGAVALMLTVVSLLLASPSFANIDLVILPQREGTQLTIYNSADLTLVRDWRQLTLKQGLNRLQFSWENTLIDPTSLDMLAKADADKIDIAALIYPPRVNNLGIWQIRSEVGGKVPMEISFFTSGISWRAFYMGTLTPDEATMRLQGYVVVSNSSGEEYENAEVRLIVGKVHLLEEIAMLAQRQPPYGRPGEVVGMDNRREDLARRRGQMEKAKLALADFDGKPREIKKEGLSEYFLYTIEGKDTIPNGWSKRLPSFDTSAIPVVNLYKYEEERWGALPVRFLSFKNDTAHQLGETPIPGGAMMVYRDTGTEQHLSYEGRSAFQYIPVDEDVELNLGGVQNVIVEPVLMNYRTSNYLFDVNGITGWDEIRTYRVEVKNTRELPVKLEITRHTPVPHWDIENKGDYGDYTKIDLSTFRYTLELKPRSQVAFEYTLTTHHGRRAE